MSRRLAPNGVLTFAAIVVAVTLSAGSAAKADTDLPGLTDVVWGPVSSADPTSRSPDCNGDARFTFWHHGGSLYMEMPNMGAAFRIDRVENVENRWMLRADAPRHPMNGFEFLMIEPGYMEVPNKVAGHRFFARCE